MTSTALLSLPDRDDLDEEVSNELLPESAESNDDRDDLDLSSLGFDNHDDPKGSYTQRRLGPRGEVGITTRDLGYAYDSLVSGEWDIPVGNVQTWYKDEKHVLRNSGSRNTLPTPKFTISPFNLRDLDDNSIDSHNQSMNLDDQSMDYGGPSAALLGQSRVIDGQTPSSPANMNQPTHSHAPQQTDIFQSANLRAGGSLYGRQPGFSPYPTPYSNGGQGWGQSGSLVSPGVSSSAALSGDEKSTSMSRSSSRSKQKNSFTCENEDCTASFSRLADLQRHQSAIHTKEKLFSCSVYGCSRVKDRGFSRRDHLTEHLRSYHAMPIPKRKPG